MAMTILEATVEIVKSTTQTGEYSQIMNIVGQEDREKFLKGIEEVYKTLYKLEVQKHNGKLKIEA